MEDWNVCQRKYLTGPGYRTSTDAFSEYCVGIGYMSGFFGQKDYNQAMAWWSKAAAQGQSGAQVALGYTYEKGHGAPVDTARAMQLYRQAAARNNGDALFNIGRLYHDGIGVPVNAAEADRYYKLAAAQGSEDAKRALVMAGQGTGPAPGQSLFDQGERMYKAKNYAGAFQLFMQSANAGNLRAQLQVGSQYEQGEGVAKNPKEAVRWYLKAAQGGDSQAMKNLGTMYENGQGTPEDWAEAVKWYSRSAAKIDAAGEFALGRMYEFGMGVPQDRAKAIEWFQKSGELGNTQGAYFARWLADPTNNIGFRNNEEQQMVIANKLRFAGNLIGADPAGVLFRNSQERLAYIQGLRRDVDATEAMTMWKVKKANFDSCQASHGSNCASPGAPPK